MLDHFAGRVPNDRIAALEDAQGTQLLKSGLRRPKTSLSGREAALHGSRDCAAQPFKAPPIFGEAEPQIGSPQPGIEVAPGFGTASKCSADLRDGRPFEFIDPLQLASDSPVQ
jgi:hypothetical protein